MGLIRNLSKFEEKHFVWGVRKRKIKAKLWGFIVTSFIMWILDYEIGKLMSKKMNIYVFLGHSFPQLCHFCFEFLYSEILIFTKNNFNEINSRLSRLAKSVFDIKYVINLLESHNDLLDMSREENYYFAIPFLAHLCHTFFTFIFMYSGFGTMILKGSFNSWKGLFELLNYCKWFGMYVGSWMYSVNCWVQITEEVSHINEISSKNTS